MSSYLTICLIVIAKGVVVVSDEVLIPLSHLISDLITYMTPSLQSTGHRRFSIQERSQTSISFPWSSLHGRYLIGHRSHKSGRNGSQFKRQGLSLNLKNTEELTGRIKLDSVTKCTVFVRPSYEPGTCLPERRIRMKDGLFRTESEKGERKSVA